MRRALAAAILALCPGGVGAQERPLPPQELRAGTVSVRFWPGDRALAERTLRMARGPLPMPGIPAGALRLHATIVLAPSVERFDSLVLGVPDWSAGVAIPEERLVVLPSYPSPRAPLRDPGVALRHELLHLALHQYLPGVIPRWFDEGYATWASGEWDEGSGWRIRLAMLRGAAPPLDSLSLGWPRGEMPARLAYLLSASAVQFLAQRGDPSAFPAFLQAWRAEGSFDAALRSVYFLTPARFEHEWRSMVRRRYGWLLAVSQVGAFWLFLTVLLLLLGTLRRRRNRERMRQLELEDRMLPPAEEEPFEEGPDWEEGGVDERRPPGVA